MLPDAKLTLRNMTRAKRDQWIEGHGGSDVPGTDRSRIGEARVLKPTDRSYEHPYYWAPFALSGHSCPLKAVEGKARSKDA